MKVEITSKTDVRVGGKTYSSGTVVNQEEDDTTKKAWIEAGIASEVKGNELKPEKK